MRNWQAGGRHGRRPEAAIAQVERSGGTDGLIYAAAEGWHPGVIGIVAGRLKERYNRPACVVALEDGVGKGSGRSLAGVPTQCPLGHDGRYAEQKG